MMHNGDVQYDSSDIKRPMYYAAHFLRRYLGGMQLRGLRKAMLAAMFVTVTLVYMSQLAAWGLFAPATNAGIQFIGTPIGTLVAALVGALYLWRMQIPRPIEVTVFAVACQYFIQYVIVSAVYAVSYSAEIEWNDIVWLITSYVLFFLALCVAYMVSYIFFVGWHAQYRAKLIVAVALIVIALVAHSMMGQGGY